MKGLKGDSNYKLKILRKKKKLLKGRKQLVLSPHGKVFKKHMKPCIGFKFIYIGYHNKCQFYTSSTIMVNRNMLNIELW